MDAIANQFDASTRNTPPSPHYARRTDRAQHWEDQPPAAQTSNGDEERYADHRGSFSKGLPHDNTLGEVDTTAFQQMTKALRTGLQADFNAIPLGSAPNAYGDLRRLANPQAGLAAELIGPNPKHVSVPPAPAFASAENAGEIAENYWMSICRDVHFAQYDVHTLTNLASADLSTFSNFNQRNNANYQQTVTPARLFRGVYPGDLDGPYLSQFLLHPCYFGAQEIDQKMQTVVPNVDYLTGFEPWLHVQNGFQQPANGFDPVRRYIRNGRDLGQWVHIDVLYQAYFNAALILLDANAPLDFANPYRDNPNNGQSRIPKEYSFGTFGGPALMTLLTEVATRALRAVWYQKWVVHRRLRPEVFGARVHMQATGKKNYGVHNELFAANVLNEVFARHGSHFLPMAFPEGSPTHPAYGAGHATVAGACTTVLKAWFDGAVKLATLKSQRTGRPLEAVVASLDGLSLEAYGGADRNDLTVGGELNKLAPNIALGRDFAGVHWRSDYSESLKLGETVAIGTLVDYVGTYHEKDTGFEGFHLQKFDGSYVKVTGNGDQPQ